VGNRVQKTLTTPAGTETTVYTYDADDRLIEETTTANGVAATTTYGWDASGRLLKKTTPTETTLYGWDSDDHLIEVKRGATEATATVQATYAYDAQGNRVRKTEKTAQGDKVTTYLTDATFPYAQVVEEKVKLGTHTETTRYVWGEGLVAQLQNGQARYVHADGLGSVKALSDGNGALTDAYAYATFGEVLSHAGTSGQPYRFAGEHYDPEAGMQYHRARWYDPAIGRFTALDPFDGIPIRPATLHRYAYAGSDPVNQTDPSGRFSLGGIAAGISAGISLALNAYLIYSTITAVGEFASGQRELTPREIGMAILWAYVGSKAGPLFGKLEGLLRRSGCLSNSFSGDTLVETEHGLRRIDEIKVDDLVMSRDLETGENELQPVSAVMTSTKLSELAVLTLESGAVIEATPEHLILADGDWVQAQHIEPGMVLSTQNGNAIKVAQTRRETRELAVYDLTIAKNRNFFVSKDRVLVHNISPCEKAAQVLAKAVPKACVGKYLCKEFAQSFEEILIKKGVKGKRLCVKSKSKYGIHSLENGNISTNGEHVAVQVGELVFDSVFPDGIPYAEWIDDIGANEVHGGIKPIDVWEEAIGSRGCL
jgi:RHS repeat-associated protein